MTQKRIQLERTYEFVCALMNLSDTICPDWASTTVNELIGDCFERLPCKMTITIQEKEKTA